MGDRTPDADGLSAEIRGLKESTAEREWRVRELERAQRETGRIVESLAMGHEMMGEEMDGEIARRLRLEDRVEALERDSHSQHYGFGCTDALTPSSGEGEPEIRPKDPWTCSSKEERPMAVAQRDLAAILRALGLGDHARVVSPHDVVHQEVLPEIRRLVEERDEAREQLEKCAWSAAADAELIYEARKAAGCSDEDGLVHTIDRLRREVERLREDAQSDREEADGFKHHLDHLLHEIFQAEPSYSDATVEEVISDAVFEVDSLRWKVRDLEEEAERLRSGGRIEVTKQNRQDTIDRAWAVARDEHGFQIVDANYRAVTAIVDEVIATLQSRIRIQPPEDGGGEPEYGRSRIAEVREQEESEPSEDAPGSDGPPDAASILWAMEHEDLPDHIRGSITQDEYERAREDLVPTNQPTEAPEGEDPLEAAEARFRDHLREQMDRGPHERGTLQEEADRAFRRAARQLLRHYRPRRVTEEDLAHMRHAADFPAPSAVKRIAKILGLHLPGEEGR